MPHPDGHGHPEVGAGVEDCGPELGFIHLPFKGAGVEAVTELLEPVHHVLGKAAPVVATVVLPAGESLGFDFLENGVARVAISPRDRTVAGRDGGPSVPFGDRCMAAVAVVGAIGRDLRNLPLDLVEQAGQDFAVAPIGGGNF